MSTIYPIGNDQGTIIINKLTNIAQALNTIKINGVYGELSEATLNNAIDGITIILNNDGNISVGSIPTSSLTGTIPTSSLSGIISTENLPSYVDDVIEGYMYQGNMFSDSTYTNAIIGETGKIYVDLLTDTSYRWSGSAWISISNPVEIATEAEAIQGTNNTKMMTPLRVAQALASSKAQIENMLNLKAPLISPSLEGSPTAPTPSTGSRSTRIATTEFVQNELDALKSRISALEDEASPLQAAIENDYLILNGSAVSVSNDYTEIISSNVDVEDDYLQF